MGLFSLFKKKNRPQKDVMQEQIQSNFNPLDFNSVVGYLEKEIRKKKPHATDQEVIGIIKDVLTPKQEELDHLTSEGELPYGWYYANKDFTDRVHNEYNYFLAQWINNKFSSPKDQYAAIKSLVVYIEDIRKLCDKKGECFSYWLSKKFCLRDEDYNNFVDKMKYIEDHYEELETEYQNKIYIEQVVIPMLRKELPKHIKAAPGILQTEIYKLFPPKYKDHVSYELYKMAKEGLIDREKSGRTYSLKMKN